ncbi:MAG: mevalonate kinase [Cytophagales bacterium]|nr:MAG: mevalonate kinase [Cytophagales bacterium]TAF61356.1 MAG: mevalonate kinase [Cytophagales bacterium]
MIGTDSRVFNSKILLFGEYSILHDSMALAVPYPLFQGQLAFKRVTQSSQKLAQSNQELQAFSNYISLKIREKELETDFDFSSLAFDIAQGLYFESTIPQGFGVGSSGALTAALYDRYSEEKPTVNASEITVKDILALKKVLGKMESHFHGSSSGMDPLICYLNKPLLIRSKDHIQITQVPPFKKDKGAIFLLNTGRPRRTEPLVSLYLEKCKNPDFAALCKDKLAPCADAAIAAFLDYQKDDLLNAVAHISRFQWEHFQPMIPTLFADIWKKGLDTGAYHLKLCGAGGGGFILGFTDDFSKAREILQHQLMRVIYEI